MTRPRRTLAAATETLSGVGLHSGKEAAIIIRPASPGAGLVFWDVASGQEIYASAANVIDTSRCTILGESGVTVQTVEHVLSALAGMGIDDAVIETRGGEMPAADGSALPFVRMITAAGVRETPDMKIAPFIVNTPIFTAGKDGSCLVAIPGDTFRVTVTLDYPLQDYLGTLSATFDAGADDYAVQVAAARTYGFVAEIEWLRAHGLALGASRENAIALGDVGYETPLRFANELARHKLLDVIGDLSLAQRPVQAHVLAFKPSHALNVQLAKLLA